MNYEKYIFNLSGFILFFIFIVSTCVFVLLIIMFLGRINEIFERFKTKFPQRGFYESHPGLVIVMLFKSMLGKNTKEKKKKKHINPDDIRKWNLVKMIIFIIKTKFNKILKNIFLFLTLFFISPFFVSPALNNTILKNHRIFQILSEFLFAYVYYFMLLVFLGYKISEFSPILSMILICLYLFLTIWTCIDKFNYPTNIKKINKKLDVPIYFNLLLGLIVGFASLYYNICQLFPLSFNIKLDFINSLYFSIITFATVGYGDIYPKSSLARLLVSLETLLSIFVLVFLASVFINWRNNDKADLK